jgi:hypothetical protein
MISRGSLLRCQRQQARQGRRRFNSRRWPERGVTADHAKRQTAKIALVAEFGGDSAFFRDVAREAIKRGMYSSNSNLGDIEGALQRTWRKWKRTRVRQKERSER